MSRLKMRPRRIFRDVGTVLQAIICAKQFVFQRARTRQGTGSFCILSTAQTITFRTEASSRAITLILLFTPLARHQKILTNFFRTVLKREQMSRLKMRPRRITPGIFAVCFFLPFLPGSKIVRRQFLFVSICLWTPRQFSKR